MRTDGKVIIVSPIGKLKSSIEPYAVCLIGQPVAFRKDGRFYPDTSTDIIKQDGLIFAEDACNPVDLTIVLNERPA
jgi:hypothetical protein